MSKENEAPAVPTMDPATLQMVTAISQAIGQAVGSAVVQAQPPRQITAAQYDPKTPFHPNKKTAIKPTRDYYQNGSLLKYETTFDREYELLNQITHSGKYIDEMVTVNVIRVDGEDKVSIEFKTRTADQRLDGAHRWKNFAHMLEQIVDAQRQESAIRAEDELERQTRPSQRHFGDTKAMREAKARLEP